MTRLVKRHNLGVLLSETPTTAKKYFVLTIACTNLLILSYGLISYLKKPKFGFTYAELSKENKFEKLQIESLIIAETFGNRPSRQKRQSLAAVVFEAVGLGESFRFIL